MSQTPSPRSSSDEQRPLLDSDATSDSPTQAGWLHRQLPAAFDSLRQTVWPFAILAFLLELSNVLLDVSATSLREQAICDEYYRRRGGLIGIWSSPSHCKIPPIQIEFQFVQSWQVVYDGLAAILAAVPLAILANRHGYRKVFACTLGGITTAVLWTTTVCLIPAMPNFLVWLSSIFRLVGGGTYTTEILLVTMLVRTSKGGTRLRNLYIMYMAFALAEVVGMLLSAVAPKISIWLPIGLGLGALFVCFLVVAAIPETEITAQITSLVDNQEGGTATRLNKILSQIRLQNSHIALPMLYAAALRMAVQGFSAGPALNISEILVFVGKIMTVNLLLPLFVLPAIIVTAAPSPE